jgi:hypothetical protein
LTASSSLCFDELRRNHETEYDLIETSNGLATSEFFHRSNDVSDYFPDLSDNQSDIKPERLLPNVFQIKPQLL